jgi:hypothetical protein
VSCMTSPNVFGAAIHAWPSLPGFRIDVKAELGGNHYLLPERRDCLIHELFVKKGP